jgi:hypothetical protein
VGQFIVETVVGMIADLCAGSQAKASRGTPPLVVMNGNQVSVTNQESDVVNAIIVCYCRLLIR